MSAQTRVAAALTLVVACAGCAPHEEVTVNAIDTLAQEVIERGPVLGMAVAVRRNGRMTFEGAWGYGDTARTEAVHTKTVFDIASVTKLFTSTLVLQMVDEGRLSLDARLPALLPELGERWNSVSLRHLLAQTSGVPDYIADGDPVARARGAAVDAAWMYDWLARKNPDFAPGDRWSYSNTNFFLAGLVLERVSGRRYGEVFAERVARPAGLERMGPCFDEPLHAEHRLFQVTESGITANVAGLETPVFADGGLCASAADLARAAEAVFARALLSDASRTALVRRTSTARGEVDYGLGARLGALDGHLKWGHTGGMQRSWASVAHYPDDSLTIAVLVNTDGYSGPGAVDLEARIARIVLGIATPEFAGAPLPAARREALCGTFDLLEEGERKRFLRFASGDSLMEQRLPDGEPYALHHLGDGVFGRPEWNELRVRSDLREPVPATITTTGGGFFFNVAYRVDTTNE
jgi:CubicO group peptidase (beta-lactamase class C family)